MQYKLEGQLRRTKHCNRCCHDKLIPVSPYEVARLAANLELSTTEVIERFTVDGNALAFPDGACTFLTERGCSVHADRPLVCRLYPLGRVAQPDGTETWVELAPHPATAGEYGTAGTLEQYVESQDAAAMVEATRRYYALLGRVVALVAAEEGTADSDEPVDEPPDLIDIDAALAGRGIAVPGNPWEKMELHLDAVSAWLDAFET